MKHKLIMIWHLLRSKDWIVVTEKEIIVNAEIETIGRAIGSLAPILIKEAVKTQQQMDSAVDEVNNILNGIK